MNITIVGSGFGGVKVTLLLAKNKKNKITLIKLINELLLIISYSMVYIYIN